MAVSQMTLGAEMFGPFVPLKVKYAVPELKIVTAKREIMRTKREELHEEGRTIKFHICVN